MPWAWPSKAPAPSPAPTDVLSLPPDYPALLSRLDAWQDGVRERFPGVVPCRAGCSACCHGPFDSSVADAREVVRGVAGLDAAAQEAIRARAGAQVRRIQELTGGFDAPYELAPLGEERFDAVAETLAGEPCPALDDSGRCMIYPFRPMVCRMMGLGMETGSGPLENACPIQDDFPGYAALPPQWFDLGTWEAEEATALEGAAAELLLDPGRRDYETTIAGAVLLGAV